MHTHRATVITAHVKRVGQGASVIFLMISVTRNPVLMGPHASTHIKNIFVGAHLGLEVCSNILTLWVSFAFCFTLYFWSSYIYRDLVYLYLILARF